MANAEFFLLSRLGLQKDWYCELGPTSKIADRDLWDYMRGKKKPTTAVSVIIKGKKPVDMIYGIDTFVVNERVIELLSEKKFTGWASYPVRSKKGSFQALVFKGKSGKLPDGHEIIISKKSWDGKDFFVPKDTALKCVTARVAEAFAAAKITGAYIEAVKSSK